jgi:hypothetical protein
VAQEPFYEAGYLRRHLESVAVVDVEDVRGVAFASSGNEPGEERVRGGRS